MELIKKDKLSICIVSHNAYGAISGGKEGHIGGVEWQTTITAKWFAQKGYPVSMITWDEGGPKIEYIDGVRIIKVCRQDEGIPGLRFFYPKWTSLNKALALADADLYYHNCSECETGQIAYWCKKNVRKFIYSTAGEPECNIALPNMKRIQERILFRYGIKNANSIIVQTVRQKNMLSDGWGLKSTVIPMPSPETSRIRVKPRRGTPSNRILWIGRFCKQKRPDRIIDIAKKLPHLTFDIVGPIYDDEYSKEQYEKAKKVSNIVIHGSVPRSKVYGFYENSACMCSTPDFEGFPNTYLEAWSYGLPIISMFDPDDIIKNYELGIFAYSLAEFCESIKTLLNDKSLYQRISKNVIEYFYANHAKESVMPKFERIFISTYYQK